MNITSEQLLLYAVTDRSWLGEKSLSEQVEEAVKAGVTLVQFRDKNLSCRELIEEAEKLHEVTMRYNIPLILNDNLQAAVEINAEGVHLGLADASIAYARSILGKGKIIGASAHSVEEALAAQADGADYLGVGAVFGSATKTNATYLSRDTLIAICQAVTIPVVAIGGINEDNIQQLKGTGINGVAVVSAIFASESIKDATKKLLQLAIDITKHSYQIENSL